MNKLKSNSKPLIWLMGLLLTVFVAGCGSGGDGGGTTAQPGTLGVSLTDAPACGFDEVNITVSKVRVHQSGSADDKAAGWTDITLDPPLHTIAAGLGRQQWQSAQCKLDCPGWPKSY